MTCLFVIATAIFVMGQPPARPTVDGSFTRLESGGVLQERANAKAAPPAIAAPTWEGRGRVSDRPDLPARRAEFRRLQERDERGRLPSGARGEAIRRLEDRVNRHRDDLTNIWKVESLDAGAWAWLGPKSMGGRLRSLVIHPSRPELMWLGSVGGGIWRSRDAGAHWAPVDDYLPSLAISSMAIDKRDPKWMYAASGEVFAADLRAEGQDPGTHGLRSSGILRSNDGGDTWDSIKNTVPKDGSDDFLYLNRVALTSDGRRLLAAANNGIIWTDEPTEAVPTWNWARDGDTPASQGELSEHIADVKIDPEHDSDAVAGGLFNGAAYYSRDRGQSWHRAAGLNCPTGGDTRVELTYASTRPKGGPAIVYASVNTNGGKIWRSDDGGKSYFGRRSVRADDESLAKYLKEQGQYDNAIWAGDPDNPDFVIVGGIDLWKSLDGGDTLRQISDGRNEPGLEYNAPYSVHSDHHLIVSHPDFGRHRVRTVYFGNDGGLYKTDDIDHAGEDPFHVRGWTSLNQGGYGAGMFYGGAGDPATGVLVAGAQDFGTFIYRPDKQSWHWYNYGDGGFCAIDSRAPGGPFLYGEHVNLTLYRFEGLAALGGEPRFFFGWPAGKQVTSLPYQVPNAGEPSGFNFIAPFLLDPKEPRRLLAGGRRLWVTDDVRAAPAPQWRAASHVHSPFFISAIAVDPENSAEVWIGGSGGALDRTTNGLDPNPTWKRFNEPAARLLPNRFCTRIVIDPLDKSSPRRHLYVTFGGYAPNNIWETRDAGNTWLPVIGPPPRAAGDAAELDRKPIPAKIPREDFPKVPVRSLAIHPDNPRRLYAGTEIGLYSSSDGGISWVPPSLAGPADCPVDDLLWMGKKLIAVTHGRGLYSLDTAQHP